MKKFNNYFSANKITLIGFVLSFLFIPLVLQTDTYVLLQMVPQLGIGVVFITYFVWFVTSILWILLFTTSCLLAYKGKPLLLIFLVLLIVWNYVWSVYH